MELWISPWLVPLLYLGGLAALCQADQSTSFSYKDNFYIMWAEDHFNTSPDGQVWFFADWVAIRVHKNNGQANNFFPNEKPMYMFSSIWNASWTTRGGLDKTNWTNESFVSSYKDFHVDRLQWEDLYQGCVSTTFQNWWDQSDAWSPSPEQQDNFNWININLIIYDYQKDYQRNPTLQAECKL